MRRGVEGGLMELAVNTTLASLEICRRPNEHFIIHSQTKCIRALVDIHTNRTSNTGICPFKGIARASTLQAPHIETWNARAGTLNQYLMDFEN